MTEEDEAFEELSCKQSDWGMQGSRKHQIMQYVENAEAKETSMKARTVFIALMTGKGYAESELVWDGEKFANQNMTTRWNYFLLGWEMRGVM
jgi:hypothetical protein